MMKRVKDIHQMKGHECDGAYPAILLDRGKRGAEMVTPPPYLFR
jgi:hypothetical protein